VREPYKLARRRRMHRIDQAMDFNVLAGQQDPAGRHG
jgi:hypothetical protein